MAKTLKKEAETPDAGSSPQIPNRNEEAVFLSHLNKLRMQSAKAAIKKAEYDAEGQGYTAGLRGDDSTMPDNFPPHHAPAFLRGYHAGQEKLAWAMSEAGTNPEKADSGLKLVASNDADAKKPAA